MSRSYIKPALTYQQQIDRLRQLGLSILDEARRQCSRLCRHLVDLPDEVEKRRRYAAPVVSRSRRSDHRRG